MSNPINSQIQNLRLRIEILQDRMEIESKTCYELSLKEALTSASKFEYERLSCMTVTQIGKRIDVLEDELHQLLLQPGSLDERTLHQM